jgi:Cd2+/Zn2+-exporting ATPase
VSLTDRGQRLLCGSVSLLREQGVSCPDCQEPGVQVHVAVDGRYAGCILIADTLKPDSADALQALKRKGVRRTVILTGDDRRNAEEAAKVLKPDLWYARLLPADKVAKLEQLAAQVPKGRKIAFVGDGINDAPVLARSDVGIAMGGLGSDAAIEAADVVLMTDEPSRLAEAVDIAKATRRIVLQNILFALSVKGLCLLLGALGLAGMWSAVFADVGVTLLAVLNALRMLRK